MERYTVAETAGGIYTVKGDILPMQIIDSRRLSADDNLWLKSLSDELGSLEVKRIGDEAFRQGKAAPIAAYHGSLSQSKPRNYTGGIYGQKIIVNV
jgi:hypothetical protein